MFLYLGKVLSNFEQPAGPIVQKVDMLHNSDHHKTYNL